MENDYTFVADDEEMKVEISYTFNASALGGKNLVTFEELYDLSNPDEPVKVAEHKDIEDDGQTVLITERIVKIHTTATDKDGNKELEAGKDVTIIDTVTLEGLEVGTQYKLVGWQMLKEENAELLINGNPSNFRELVKKDCTLDLHLSILKYQEQSIELTRNEFRILYYFFMNEDKVISKEELLEKLWNDKYYIDENVLLVNMTRLKKKMKEIGIVHLLENIRGKGWKL